MDAKIISAASFIEAFDACVERVKNRKPDLNKKHTVIVPDKYTLYAERRLFQGGGAFDVEVVTFNRLLGKLGCRPKNYISRFGAIMLLRKLMGDGNDLQCFKRSVKFAGFAEKIYDTLAQLIASGVTPDMLTGAQGALQAKTQDIKYIYEKYLDAIRGKYVDSSALLMLLPKALENSDYLEGANVYVLNFDRLTKLHADAISAMSKKADVTIYSVQQKKDTVLKHNAQTIVYTAPDSVSEWKAAAQRIRCDVYERGYKYSDFCIVSAQAEFETVRRIFGEYNIPLSLDKKYSLLLHPASKFLLCALDAADTRLKRCNLISLAKNALSGITPRAAAAFENYCNRYRVDYKGFLSPFDKPDSEEAESVRLMVTRIALDLQNKLHTYMSAREFANTALWVLDCAAPYSDLVSAYDLVGMENKLREIIALMSDVLGEQPLPAELLKATLKEGIAGCEIATLPALSDCVTVGEPALFRGQHFKRVIVVGFNEGVMPPITEDCGIITDGEIDELQELGAAVEPKTEEVNERARSELLHLLAGCDRLFLCCTASDDGRKPSSLLGLIRQSNLVISDSAASERERLTFGADGMLLERTACCASAAKELFLQGVKTAPSATPYLSTLAAALKQDVKALLSSNERSYVLPRRYNVFFPKGTVSISQVQTFFCCPYRHFLEYGLRLKERPDGEVSPKDVGIILHRIAELYTQGGDFENAEQRAQTLFTQIMDKEFSAFSDLSEGAKRRLKEESVRLCRTIAAQLNDSRYRCLGQEMLFSPTSPPPLRSPSIRLKDGSQTAVVGVIDRVDVCGERARVIDYKTGYLGSSSTEIFSLTKLYYGVKFQLQLYAEILRRGGYKSGGMFYFPIGNNWTDDGEYCMMTGAFDGCLDAVYDMDTALAQGGKSRLFKAETAQKKDGSMQLKRNSLAFTSTQMENMCSYAAQVFESGVKDIDDGFITPLPYVHGTKAACEFCPYAPICASDKEKKVRTLSGNARGAVAGEDKQ